MIPLDGQIKKAVIESVTSRHVGVIGASYSGTISEIMAEIATKSKEKVNVKMILGVLATKKIRKKIGKLDDGKSLIGKRIEIVIE